MELQTPGTGRALRAPSDPTVPSSWDLPVPRYGHFRSSFDRVYLGNQAEFELQTPGVGRDPRAPHDPRVWSPKSASLLRYGHFLWDFDRVYLGNQAEFELHALGMGGGVPMGPP